MSRTVNEALSRRILAAAKRLWHDAGEEGLTIRAVADAARTTTPSVYQRFPSKQDLVAALSDQARLRLGAEVLKSDTLEEACERYLAAAQKAPHEYSLIFGPALPRIMGASRRPVLEWFQQQFAQRSGHPDPETSAYGLFLLLHGAASMLQFAPEGEAAEEIRDRCLRACKEIIHGSNGHSRYHRKR